jgi:hypothetical protein
MQQTRVFREQLDHRRLIVGADGGLQITGGFVQFNAALEFRPAREAIFTSDDQLRITKRTISGLNAETFESLNFG